MKNQTLNTKELMVRSANAHNEFKKFSELVKTFPYDKDLLLMMMMSDEFNNLIGIDDTLICEYEFDTKEFYHTSYVLFNAHNEYIAKSYDNAQIILEKFKKCEILSTQELKDARFYYYSTFQLTQYLEYLCFSKKFII